MDVLALSGTYEEMGSAYGAAQSELIRANYESYERRFRDNAHLTDAEIRRWGAHFRMVITAYSRDIDEMLTAMAEAAGISVERAYALNARTELLFGSGYHEEGCTSLAVLGSRTRDGSTYIAQNWDWRLDQGPLSFILATRDTEGHAVITLCEAGMLAKSGMNSAGIGICSNMLVSDRDAAGDGIPYHFLLRGVLQSTSMADALDAVTRPQRISSGNSLLAAAGGEAIDIEFVPDDFRTILPDDGLVAHANHFESLLPVKDLRRTVSPLTLLRSARVRHLLEDQLEARDVSREDVHAVLHDHFSFPKAICRHPDLRDDPLDQSASLFSIVMDLDEGVMDVTGYPACETAPSSVALSDSLWNGDASA